MPEFPNSPLIFVLVNAAVAILVPLVTIVIPQLIQHFQNKAERKRQRKAELGDRLDKATQDLLDVIADGRPAANQKTDEREKYEATLRKGYFAWERAAWKLADPFDQLELEKTRDLFNNANAHYVRSNGKEMSGKILSATYLFQLKSEKETKKTLGRKKKKSKAST